MGSLWDWIYWTLYFGFWDILYSISSLRLWGACVQARYCEEKT